MPRALFVDVDNTLLVDGMPNPLVIDLIRTANEKNIVVFVWSSRGQAYARSAIERAQVDAQALPKPGWICDDAGWRWIKHVKRVRLR